MSSESSNEEIVKVKSSRFGDFEVTKASVINIVSGIIGFPGVYRYVLLDYNPPFSWLQSAESPELAFVVVNAAEFGDDYIFKLPIGDRELDLNEDDEVAILNLVSVRPNPTDTTVNLKAPVVINLRTMSGRQIVLDDPNIPIRLPLWASEEEQEASKEEK